MKTIKVKQYWRGLGEIITVFLFLIVCITLIINFTLNNIFISKYFSNIEKEQVISKAEQSRKVFQSKMKEIERIVQDYALWDENYYKIQGERIDEKWYDDNFIAWLPEKYGIDLVVVINKNKKVIAQHGLNNSNDILNDNKLLQSLNREEYNEKLKVSGFKKYNGDLYMISECPVFKNTSAGTCQGVVIIGKKISPKFIESIKEEFGTDIFITYDNNFVSSKSISKEVNENSTIVNENKNNSVYKFSNSKIIGSLPIADLTGNNIGYLNVMQSTDTFLSTRKLTKGNTFIAMLLSTIVILILGWRVKNIIIKPIKSLENQIKKMEQGNLLIHANVNANSPNEIINLTKSFNHMVDSIHEHKKENEELKVYANTDYLTSVYNHKYFFESFNKMLDEGYKQISVMFCDIDKFKLTNDSYGHEVGDLILKETAKVIKSEIKDAGMVFRYGGEEFAVIICNYSSEEALVQAEKIRKSIAKHQVLQEYANYFPITISIGIASYPRHALDAEGLIKKSDTAMYYSKQSGRNQCNIYNDNMKVFLNNNNRKVDKELLMDSVLALAEAVDTKDNYTGKHSKMVLKYANLLAEKLEFTEDEKNKLRIGALLHDCGKIGIPDNVINKPEKLSEDEFELIKNHTLLGYNIIKHITNDEEIIDCVRSHHERWDGKGYPNRLSGDSINLFARIVCIADVYHAMTSDRSYRKALTKEQAIDEFIKGKGTQFDPTLVNAFIEIIKYDMEDKDIHIGA